MKKTKIVATIGPACRSKEVLTNMIKAGMNVARINLSHQKNNDRLELIEMIRSLGKELNTNVAIMYDTCGPEIRSGEFESGKVELIKGNEVEITTSKVLGTDKLFTINYNNLITDISVGDIIVLHDGQVSLKVTSIKENVVCKVVDGGILYNKTGVNIPGMMTSLPFLSERDIEDIKEAAKYDVDFIALSFVRSSEDVLEVNDLLIELGNDHMGIISKIECSLAVDDIKNIVDASDGVMIARGDLGIEIPLEEVPCIQKMIVKECYEKNKVSIVATEMLASMEENSRPTRAEVSDVANAVIDGADAVMLSGETAMGNYPIEAVKMMNKIIVNAEDHINHMELLKNAMSIDDDDITNAIAFSVVDSANKVKAASILASTTSGETARKISRFRPSCIIIASSFNEKTVRSLALNWGVYAFSTKKCNSTDEIIESAISIAKSFYKYEYHDKVIITGGFPSKDVKYTNFMKIEEL